MTDPMDTPLTDMDGDNPPTLWTAQAALKEHAALQASNAEVLNEMARDDSAPDALTMLKLRVDFLTQQILAGDPEVTLKFAIGWEQHVAAVLSGAQQQVRMNRLVNGVVPQVPGQMTLA